jgi:hypothetical protein
MTIPYKCCRTEVKNEECTVRRVQPDGSNSSVAHILPSVSRSLIMYTSLQHLLISFMSPHTSQNHFNSSNYLKRHVRKFLRYVIPTVALRFRYAYAAFFRFQNSAHLRDWKALHCPVIDLEGRRANSFLIDKLRSAEDKKERRR